MASRINTKFVLLLIIAAGVVGAVVGAMWYLNRTDVTQLVQEGDAFAAEGDYRKAARFYERAIGKEPGSAEYLAKMEAAVLEIRPDTGDEARQRYTSYMSILRHGATHHPSDPDRYLRFLNEMHKTFRRSNSWAYSEAIIEASDDMWERLPASEPTRQLAKFYRGAARISPWMHDRLTEEEVAMGERDLEEFLEVMPEHDAAWATLIDGRLGLAIRYREAGQPTRAAERLDRVRENVASALERVPDGPETLLVSLNFSSYLRQIGEEVGDVEALRARVERMVRVVREQRDPWLNTQAAAVLARLAWIEDLPDPLLIIDEYLQAEPLAHDQRLSLARLHYRRAQFDDAEREAQVVLDAELLPVGYLSQFQPELRRSAASLMLDVAMGRWEQAPIEERGDFVPGIEQALATLEGLVSDPEENPVAMRGRAKLAFARKDYDQAAALFNRLVGLMNSPDFETLMFSAFSLEQVRQIGTAVERYEAALRLSPGNVELMSRLARARLELKHYELARDLASQILQIDENHEAARIILTAAEGELGKSVAETGDPVQMAIEQAQKEIDAGSFEQARSLLLAVHEERPDDLRLLHALVRVEMIMGREEQALGYVARGLVKSPGNRSFLSLKARIENDDPIETIRQFVTEESTDEVSEHIEMMLGMRQLAEQKEREAEFHDRAGRDELATAARTLATRAREEERSEAERVQQLAPHNSRFIEYRFVGALRDEDWKAALAIIDEAKQYDADQAGGATFQGRYELRRGDAEAAVRAFRDAADRISYSDQVWRLLAMAYQRAGNLDEALSALERSYTNNPSHVETVLAYGALLARTGNPTRALQVMRTGRRLAPDMVQMREQWLTLEREVGDPAVCLQQRARYYEENPDERVNAAELAMFLGTEEPGSDLLLGADGEPPYSPERWSRMSESARARAHGQLREAWRERADEILEALAPEGERDLPWYVVRSRLLKGRGDIDDGAAVLRDFAERASSNEARLEALLALSTYYSELRQNRAAIDTLTEALQYQAPDSHRADLALGELYFGLQQYDAAIPLLRKATGDARTLRVQMHEAESLVMLERLDEARSTLDALEQEFGADATSTMLRAALASAEAEQLLEAGKAEEADRKYREHDDALLLAERLAPGDPMPHVLRARRLYNDFKRTGEPVNLDDALQALARADQVNDGFPRTSLTRVAVLQAKGDTRGATSELERLLERSPEQDQARQVLFQMLLDEGRIDAAVAVGEDAVRRDPTSVQWRERLGNVHMSRRRDPVAAAKQFAAGLESIRSPALLAKAAESYLNADPPRFEEAIKLIGRYQDLYEASPIVRAVYARALSDQGDRDAALKELRAAYIQQRRLIDEGKEPPARIAAWFAVLRRIFSVEEAAEAEALAMEMAKGKPDSFELLSLATIWREVGPPGYGRSAELLRLGIERCPDNTPTLRLRLKTDLAVVLLYTDQLEEALAMLEEVLKERPDNPEVLNNTAYLLAERLNRPEEALPYAERAARILPNSWSVLDTLGRVHYIAGDYEQAESVLRRSVKVERRPSNLMHLAQALERRGEFDTALRYLEGAAELRPDSQTLEEIIRLADDIRTRTKGG